MVTLEQAARDFLAQPRIAVVGVSRKGDVAANIVYRRLRSQEHDVFPVNPNADEVEGDRCYPDLASIPGGVDAVVIATPPEAARDLVQQCADRGIQQVWMHRSFGQGSVDEEAVHLGKELGLSVIPGSCPLMFCEPLDLGHRCMRWFLGVSGSQPAPVGYPTDVSTR